MIKRKLPKIRFAIFGFLILLLALSPVASVFAQGLGHGFYGTVQIGGEDAEIGTVISTRVAETEYGSCQVTTPGQYALIVQGQIQDSATINFYINGYEADQTFPFHDGWTTQLGLTVPAVAPSVATGATSSVTTTSAVLNGNLGSLGTALSVAVSFEWGTTTEYGTETAAQPMNSMGSFSFPLSGLTPGTTYHFRAIAVADGTSYGLDSTFTTGEPAIAFSPVSFTFSATEGEPVPVYLLEIWNSGTGTLGWSVSDDATWLSLSPTSGSSIGEHDSVTVSVNTSGMSAGDYYSATITISAPGATNTPQTASVSLYISTEPVLYDLTISSSAGGSVTSPGEGTFSYDADAVVSLVASPSAGYQFVNWTGDVASPNSATTTVVMDSDKTVTANFSEIPVTYYTLTMAVNGSGSTSPAVGTHDYAAGTVVGLVATPNTGYQFVNWTGDVASPNSATTTVTMDSDKTVTANFSEIPVTYYTLTMAVNGSGSTSPAVGQHTYAAGTVVPIIAIPGSGYGFVNWTGAVANPYSATTTVTMDSDKTVIANFSEIPVTYYTLTMAVSGNGTTDPPVGEHSYDVGTVVSLVASPVAGYQFVNWTGDVADPNSATTTVVMDSDKTVTANFEEIPPPLGTTDVSDDVSAVGVFINSIIATSDDGKCNLIIPEGTVGLTEDLEPLDEITMLIMDDPPDPPKGAHIIGLPYNFGPKGATFEPAITLVYTYTLADIPEGVAEEDLVIAYWDEEAGEAGEWIELICVVDTVAKTITATVSHFTAFAILTPVLPPEKPFPWPLVGIIAGVGAAGLLGFFLVRRSRRTLTT